jgi:sec-independent protein translocase protein TatA
MFGPGGISPTQLLIIFGIVILIFGTAKLKSFGSDLGSALKGFKLAMRDEDSRERFGHEARQIEPAGKQYAESSEQSETQRPG